MASIRKQKIAICACGITGTAVAIRLAGDGHDVSIFEQAPECRPIGAGILLQPSGQQILKHIGILDEISQLAQPLDGLLALKKSGKTLVRLKYEWLQKDLFGLGVHRGELFQLLLDRSQQSGVQIHTNSTLESFGGSGETRWVKTQQGKTHDGYDFIIAADGSASRLREFSKLPTKVIEYDYAAIWSTGLCKYQPDSLVQIVDGTDKLVGLLPIGRGRSSFFWGLPAADYQALTSQPIDSWKQQVLEICPNAESILQELNSFEDLTFARYRHVSMRKWWTDKIIFLGDAAHATSPHLGQGVNLGLEDAVCFSDALQETGDFKTACHQFSRIRKSKLRYYSKVTKLLSPFFQSHGTVRGRARDTFLPWFPKTPIVRREMIRTLCGFKNGWLR